MHSNLRYEALSTKLQQTSAGNSDRQVARYPRRPRFLQARSEVPQQLVRARKVKQAGVTASLTILGSSLVLLRYSDIQIPKLPPSAWPAALLALGLTFTSGLIITARELLQDRLVIELHNGRLYIQSGLTPRNGLSVPRDAIVVLPTERKGNGAFASKPISKGTYLGDYEGELLTETAYWTRYPDGVADFCMGIDSEWTIDATERAKNTSRFSAVHMNHSSTRQNVARRCSRERRCVSFYAAEDIQKDEELLLDYGIVYWTGRSDKIVD